MAFFKAGGVRILTTDESRWGEYEIRISYKTVLLYKGGENIASFYTRDPEILASCLEDYVDMDSEIIEEMANYASNAI